MTRLFRRDFPPASLPVDKRRPGRAKRCLFSLGKDTYETEDILHKELADDSLKIACIGPAEKPVSAASIVNEKGRIAAGRSRA